MPLRLLWYMPQKYELLYAPNRTICSNVVQCNQKIEIIPYHHRQIARLLAGICKTDHVRHMAVFLESLQYGTYDSLMSFLLGTWAPFGSTPQHSITSGYTWVVFERRGLLKVIQEKVCS